MSTMFNPAFAVLKHSSVCDDDVMMMMMITIMMMMMMMMMYGYQFHMTGIFCRELWEGI